MVSASLLRNAKRLTVEGYISKASSLKAPVVDLETLILLMTRTVGRDKDTVDLPSPFRDRRKDIEMMLVAKRDQGLVERDCDSTSTH